MADKSEEVEEAVTTAAPETEAPTEAPTKAPAAASDDKDNEIPVGYGQCVGLPAGNQLLNYFFTLSFFQCQTMTWAKRKLATRRSDGRVATLMSTWMVPFVSPSVVQAPCQPAQTTSAHVTRRADANGRDSSRIIVNVRIMNPTIYMFIYYTVLSRLNTLGPRFNMPLECLPNLE